MILLAALCFLLAAVCGWLARRTSGREHFWWTLLSCLFALLMVMALVAWASDAEAAQFAAEVGR